MATCNCTGACFRFGYCSATSAPRSMTVDRAPLGLTDVGFAERCPCGAEISVSIGFFEWREQIDGWRERHAFPRLSSY